MKKIIKLDQKTTNLIAAGEVIESISSVVKELVENAIDADATKIEITLEDAGLTEIIVSDNGYGMNSVNARLAIQPHATSKIKDEKDLNRIFTLGFRGEALPSIVAVSTFRLKTSPNGKNGFMIALKGGDMITEAIVAHPQGTEISVKNLFFNTPARRQHLQTPNIELSNVVYLISKISLSRPDIAFKLTNNERILIQTYGNNKVEEVIYNIYGEDVAKNLIHIFGKNSYFEVSGLITKPTISRSNKNHFNVIVNNRTVKSSKITNAVMEAYKEYLTSSRYPIAVIKIEVDPSLIDVNIHPAKLEIKFTNESELLEMISKLVKESLEREVGITEVEKSSKNVETLEDIEDDLDLEQLEKELPLDLPEEELSVEEAVEAKVVEEKKEEAFIEEYGTLDEAADKTKSPARINYPEDSLFTRSEEPIVKSFKREDFKTEQVVEEKYEQVEAKLYSQNRTAIKTKKLPPMYYIGQLHGTYLLFQDEDSFYIVDQHAAYERINYEKIKTAFKTENTINYELLVPIKFNFPQSEAVLVREKLPELNALGIMIEDFGSGSFLIRGVPMWFTRGKEKEFVEEIIFEFVSNKPIARYDFFDNLAKVLACKRSITANQYLDKIHVEYLMEDLSQCEKPYSCPHGRPTIIKFSSNEIERWFKRII